MAFKYVYIYTISLSLGCIQCFDIESIEVNRGDNNVYSPFYDAIIFHDIVDIMKEIEARGAPLEAFMRSESESEENIEDLLSEYQRHMEKKAHQAIASSVETKLPKNKTPFQFRNDVFTKARPTMGDQYDSMYYFNPLYNFQNDRATKGQFRNPFDISMPFKLRPKIANNLVDPTNYKTDPDTKDNNIVSKLRDNSPCICKEGQFPCECECKSCIFPMKNANKNLKDSSSLTTDKRLTPIILPMLKSIRNNKASELREDDNILDIRVKVEVQIPKFVEPFGDMHCNHTKSALNEPFSTEVNTGLVNVPFPYMNFPIPIEIFGLKKNSKLNRHDKNIHKKKKSRTNNGNKKHKRKFVTFHHNTKIEPQHTILEEIFNTTIYNHTGLPTNTPIANVNKNLTETTTGMFKSQTTTSVPTVPILQDVKTTTEKLFTIVNITNNHENTTEEKNLQNTIDELDGDDMKINFNKSVMDLSATRRRRETPNNTTNASTTAPKPAFKSVLTDDELLYWPNDPANKTEANAKNIITLIMEQENKKGKLNISKEVIKLNHTKALEKAIFGEVNWDDMDNVAPVFISFVGKYMRGALTFCSEKICHSMKCAEKSCIHRSCAPEARINHKGHCAGSNTTDSLASMESIMDLPSNVGFEVVNILQEKLIGKLFGKATLCISNKCISFVTAKKTFIKSKCSPKELNASGHCPNVKSVKS